MWQGKKKEIRCICRELDNWSRVATADGYSGYIKKEVLSDLKDDNEEHASTAPEYTNISKDYKINLAFHQVTSMDGNAKMNRWGRCRSEHDFTNLVSVTDNNGTISYLQVLIINQAHAMGWRSGD